MTKRVTLQVIAGALKGNSYSFTACETFLFGRSSDCQARPAQNDHTVSRHHFMVEIDPPRAVLNDLGSLNGTYVNGILQGGRENAEEEAADKPTQSDPVELKNGDRIRVGSTVFVVTIEAPGVCVQCGIEYSLPAADIAASGKALVCPLCLMKPESVYVSGIQAPKTQCRQCGKFFVSDAAPHDDEATLCQTCQLQEVHSAGIMLKMKVDAAGVYRDFDPGDLPDYELGQLLSHSPRSAVFLAHRRNRPGFKAAIEAPRPNETVAVKLVFNKGGEAKQAMHLFRREVEALRDLRHKNIVRLFDHGMANDILFLALEYCEDGSLSDLMARRGGKLPISEAGRIMLQALSGLAYAHKQGYVHRDINPGEILLTPRERGEAKLSGFSQARRLDAGSETGVAPEDAAAGTLGFMAREQLTDYKSVTPASDVWGIAACFYYAITHQLPRNFPRRVSPLKVILNGKQVPLRSRDPNIPGGLASVIERALSDDLKVRYADAGEFLLALKTVMPGGG